MRFQRGLPNDDDRLGMLSDCAVDRSVLATIATDTPVGLARKPINSPAVITGVSRLGASFRQVCFLSAMKAIVYKSLLFCIARLVPGINLRGNVHVDIYTICSVDVCNFIVTRCFTKLMKC